MNTFFKIAYLIVFICLVIVLYGIYDKMDGRYRILTGQGIKVLDTQRGIVYFKSQYGWYYFTNKGEQKTVDNYK